MADHYYCPKTAEPRHYVEKKDGTGQRPTTVRDARANGWFPSVTTILKGLSKPQLERWKMVQAATAVLTSPRVDGEDLDAFMERVLFADKEQDQEAIIAADRGTEIHAALEMAMQGKQISEEIASWVRPAVDALKTYGKVHATEQILVGCGYAGKTDLILEAPDAYWIFDAKSTKKLPPKAAWDDHVAQCAAYALAFRPPQEKPIKTANIYISTIDCGKFVIWEHEHWASESEAFMHLVSYWQIKNNIPR
jgi:hypothetical protein